MAKLTGQTLVALLEEAGYEPRSYSGRGMYVYGKECVAVRLVDGRGAWDIAWNLASVYAESDGSYSIPTPKQDSLGFDGILYWPSVEWPTETGNDNG